jgi:hypothetical protein
MALMLKTDDHWMKSVGRKEVQFLTTSYPSEE